MKIGPTLAALILAAIAAAPIAAKAADAPTVSYRHAVVDNIDIFYREAGNPRAPTLLLLHGFPSSSAMFRDLMPLLADRFHVVAPDYPGMGASEAPAAEKFKPTFDNLATVMADFAVKLNLSNYILYMQDFGGPVGMRMAVRNPERVDGLIIQNSPVSLDGWDGKRLAAIQAGAVGPMTPEKRAAAAARVVQATSNLLHQFGAAHPEQLNPDSWAVDAYALNDPEKRRIMTDLQLDIPSSLALYPAWQDYLRSRQPRTLVVWGRNDPIFSPTGGDVIKALIPAAGVHYYNTGHFALEENGVDIAGEIRRYFP
ncbi:alpha/beta fold hydrolase [Herbaspirillum sp. NPDC101396]|uniref:alpha/beta fold hydrolase n=1 Tax=Herbaspirillum sp. NPDC101396 TaxID=3364005 RepID=UPI00383A2F18